MKSSLELTKAIARKLEELSTDSSNRLFCSTQPCFSRTDDATQLSDGESVVYFETLIGLIARVHFGLFLAAPDSGTPTESPPSTPTVPVVVAMVAIILVAVIIIVGVLEARKRRHGKTWFPEGFCVFPGRRIPDEQDSSK